MKLIECQTCGSHSFTNGKCDYCGNQYKISKEPLTAKEQFMKDKYLEYQDLYNDDNHIKRVYGKTWCDDEIPDYEPLTFPETDEVSDADLFVKSETGQKISKILIYILVSVIWFAVTVFITPLFLITIAVLVVLALRKIIKKH